ncbi:hypothetical protein Tco_1109465 [Tanacetum coccineum]
MILITRMKIGLNSSTQIEQFFQLKSKLEVIIFKLEVFDHKARERAGVIAPTLGTHVHVLLTFDDAVEVGTDITCLQISTYHLLTIVSLLAENNSSLLVAFIFTYRMTMSI